MKNLMTFIFIISVNLPAWAMTSLEDADLSEVSNPQSLSIVREDAVGDPGSSEEIRPGILENFYGNSRQKSLYSLASLEPDKPLDVNESMENDEAESRYALSSTELKRENPQQQRSLLIDQINRKHLKDLVSLEENTDTTINTTAIREMNTRTLAYPEGKRNSSSDIYTYRIYFNNIEMRDTFINQRNTDIRSGSWVDIKVR
jgi:hypothetical protein